MVGHGISHMRNRIDIEVKRPLPVAWESFVILSTWRIEGGLRAPAPVSLHLIGFVRCDL